MMTRIARYRPGTILEAQYEVVETRFGGMGEILVCRDRVTTGAPLVVLKTVADDMLTNAEARAAFVHEADAWLRYGAAPFGLVLPLLAIREIEGRLYLVTPYCPEGGRRDKRITTGYRVS